MTGCWDKGIICVPWIQKYQAASDRLHVTHSKGTLQALLASGTVRCLWISVYKGVQSFAGFVHDIAVHFSFRSESFMILYICFQFAACILLLKVFWDHKPFSWQLINPSFQLQDWNVHRTNDWKKKNWWFCCIPSDLHSLACVFHPHTIALSKILQPSCQVPEGCLNTCFQPEMPHPLSDTIVTIMTTITDGSFNALTNRALRPIHKNTKMHRVQGCIAQIIWV